MKKITKLLTTFALTGLFGFTNTSGYEDNQSVNLTSPLSAPSVDFKSGQWYELDKTLYENANFEIVDFYPVTFERDFGFNYSYMGGDYYACYKFVFGSTSFRIYYGESLTQNFLYEDLDYYGETISLCFYDYVPNSLISYFKYFKLKDNETYDKVYLKEDFNLLTSQYNPLIYLGGPIFDNCYVQVPTDFGSPYDLTIFEGLFTSGGVQYTSIVLTFTYFAGVRYTFDNGKTYSIADNTPDNNKRYGLRDISYVVNGVKTSIVSYDLVSVGTEGYKAVVRPFSYRFAGNEKLTILEYSTDHPLTTLPAYNYYELLKLRPATSFDDTGAIGSETSVLGGVFGLMSLVFTSLAGFLGFEIFPNITLGLLLLIPLVATIIVLIFKVVK